MNTATLVLIIVASVVLIIIGIVALYFLTVIRRTNILLKKVDYLVEDLTYKSESLNVAVDAIVKLSGYMISLDSALKKSFSSILKISKLNKNYFLKYIEKFKSNLSNKKEEKFDLDKNFEIDFDNLTKEIELTSETTTIEKPVAKKTTTTKKAPAKKTTTTKKAPAKKPVAKKTTTTKKQGGDK